jgi:hypothetical protein
MCKEKSGSNLGMASNTIMICTQRPIYTEGPISNRSKQFQFYAVRKSFMTSRKIVCENNNDHRVVYKMISTKKGSLIIISKTGEKQNLVVSDIFDSMVISDSSNIWPMRRNCIKVCTNGIIL